MGFVSKVIKVAYSAATNRSPKQACRGNCGTLTRDTFSGVACCGAATCQSVVTHRILR